MIVFSTKFYVNKELTMEKFIEFAFDCVNVRPHYGCNSICWNGKPLYEIEMEKQKLSIVQSIDKKILALRLENRDDENVIWTNDFVYEEGDINNIILVRLARDAADKESYVSRKFNRPRLMKTILKLGYGAMDNDLPISDKPFLIKEDNLEKAEKIISGKTKYLLPLSGGITPPLYGFLRAIRNKGDFFNFSSVCPKSASLMPLSSDAILKISLS